MLLKFAAAPTAACLEPLRVTFADEQAIDIGGPRRELVTLVAARLEAGEPLEPTYLRLNEAVPTPAMILSKPPRVTHIGCAREYLFGSGNTHVKFRLVTIPEQASSFTHYNVVLV